MTAERPADTVALNAAAKLPPFKRGALPAQPLVSALPSMNANGDAIEGNAETSTLLFNDVAGDALVCDPNDPDCEVV